MNDVINTLLKIYHTIKVKMTGQILLPVFRLVLYLKYY